MTAKIHFYIEENLIFNLKQLNQWMIQNNSSSLKQEKVGRENICQPIPNQVHTAGKKVKGLRK